MRCGVGTGLRLGLDCGVALAELAGLVGTQRGKRGRSAEGALVAAFVVPPCKGTWLGCSPTSSLEDPRALSRMHIHLHLNHAMNVG